MQATRAALARVGRQAKVAPKRMPKGLYAPGTEEEVTSANKRLVELMRPLARPPPRSDEERAHLRALMVRYGKHRRAKWLVHAARENRLLLAKARALDALPNCRRLEAVGQEPEPFPVDRPLFTHTPPITGFNAADLTRQ